MQNFENRKMRNFEKGILEALKKEGVDAEQVTVTKNGVPCKGFRIITSDGQVSPVVYFSEEETISEFVARVHRIMAEKLPEIPTQKMTDWKYVRDNIFLSLGKRGTEEVVKKQYLNLELQIRLRLDLGPDQSGTIRVTEKLIEATGVSEEDFWKAAEKNTASAAFICSMAELLGLYADNDDTLYVATTHLPGGASVLYLSDLFRQYCEEHGEGMCYILPSSTEEVIVIAGSKLRDDMDVSDLAYMVNEINTAQVDPILQLEPVVYQYTVSSREIKMICKAEVL